MSPRCAASRISPCDLAERQQQSFDRLVQKEIDRAEQWKSSEFNQRSRADDARDR
jgi:hypothetical protein